MDLLPPWFPHRPPGGPSTWHRPSPGSQTPGMTCDKTSGTPAGFDCDCGDTHITTCMTAILIPRPSFPDPHSQIPIPRPPFPDPHSQILTPSAFITCTVNNESLRVENLVMRVMPKTTLPRSEWRWEVLAVRAALNYPWLQQEHIRMGSSSKSV